MTSLKRIESIEETNRADAKAMLLEAAEAGFDSVIIISFNHKAHQFSIKSSRCHERLELLGALREAEPHFINAGVLK